jgi:hypothetical protein
MPVKAPEGIKRILGSGAPGILYLVRYLHVFGLMAVLDSSPAHVPVFRARASGIKVCQLTKRALVRGDTEKGAREWANEPSLGQVAGQMALATRG